MSRRFHEHVLSQHLVATATQRDLRSTWATRTRMTVNIIQCQKDDTVSSCCPMTFDQQVDP
jgi:hypothetical protein